MCVCVYLPVFSKMKTKLEKSYSVQQQGAGALSMHLPFAHMHFAMSTI